METTNLEYKAYLAAQEIEGAITNTWGTRTKKVNPIELKDKLNLFYRESRKPHILKASVYYSSAEELARKLKLKCIEQHFSRLNILASENERDDRIAETMMDAMWGLK